MTEILLDGFAHYGRGAASVANMLAGVWGNVGSSVTCDVPPWDASGEPALIYGGFNNGATRFPLPTPGSHFILSFRFAVDALVAGSPMSVSFMDASAVALFSLGNLSTGALALVQGEARAYNTIIAQTSGPVIVAENWHFFEMEVNTATNTFTLRVDDAQATGTPILTVTNAQITGTIAQLGFLVLDGGGGSGAHVQIKDLFIRDTTGTVNSGWLGDRRIATLLADADTTTAGWTPRYYYSGVSSGLLDVTPANACVSAATATSLNVGAGDFTIETRVRFKALPSGTNQATIFGKWDATANQRSYQFFLGSQSLNGGSLCFQTSTDGAAGTVAQPIVYPWTPELDRWYHVAVVRASGELLLFVDGQQLGLPITDSSTYFAGAAPLGVAGQVETTAGAVANTTLTGWLDETRFTVGFARYTANFTPPAVLLPRGSVADSQWADVALLCGYDSLGLVQDESSFVRALTTRNSAAQITVDDGPSVGAWSTVGKTTPDDNSFIEAPYTAATSILTLSAQPAANNTVTVGTKAAATPAVYTFKAAVAAAFDVLVDTTLQGTLQNLYNAINAGPGAGTKYGTGTTSNLDVSASQLPAGQMQVTALTAGTAGNSIATSVSLTNGGGWTGTTLSGGTNIPGPSDFKVQRPPPLTTIISAVQITYRALKSDAGTCSVNSALVGPLGGVTSDTAHNLTTSASVYRDLYHADPDTAASITPATIINGRIRLNRAT